MTIPDALALFLLCTKGLLGLVSIVFLVSGCDDCFIDLCHLISGIYRRLFGATDSIPVTADRLSEKPEQPVVVMIPAWDESAVIRRMLEANLARIRYGKLHIFVGTYPNDPATNHEVECARERHPNVHRVVCPNDGPTNKADCLNWIYQGIRLFEEQQGIRFEVFALNDSEDVIHPLCYKLFNYLIPELDMVQLPVIPFETPWWWFTSGHYLDEFAENHGKDMVIRGRLAGGIPAAGVGCAFSRRAIEWASEASQNEIFSPESLAEDYDFGMRLRGHDLKQAFVRVSSSGSSRRPEYIGIREYFPSRFRAAMRQKARWIVGISLQGWRRLGWRGDVRMKYALIRDRKGLVTIPAVAVGYFTVIAIVMIWMVQWLRPDFYRFAPIVERGSWLWYVTLTNGGFLGLRLIQRSRFVWRVHGWRQALLAVPRQVWGNLVNVAAVSRAFYLFAQSLASGRCVRWDKTTHTFPSPAVLMTARRKLGDLLLDERLVTVAQLDEALQMQLQRARPLGSILRQLELVDEDQIVRVLARQHGLSVRPVDPYAVSLELIRAFPRALAVRHSLFPLEDDGATVVVAGAHPMCDELRAQLQRALSRRVETCLAAESDIAFALWRGYERLTVSEPKQRLGDQLVAAGLLSQSQLCEALRRQRRSYARFGTLLDQLGLVSNAMVEEALGPLDIIGMRIGEAMVVSGQLTSAERDRAVQLQQARFLPLGKILLQAGLVSPDVLERHLREVSVAA